jgi:hypothetical protein
LVLGTDESKDQIDQNSIEESEEDPDKLITDIKDLPDHWSIERKYAEKWRREKLQMP